MALNAKGVVAVKVWLDTKNIDWNLAATCDEIDEKLANETSPAHKKSPPPQRAAGEELIVRFALQVEILEWGLFVRKTPRWLGRHRF